MTLESVELRCGGNCKARYGQTYRSTVGTGVGFMN